MIFKDKLHFQHYAFFDKIVHRFIRPNHSSRDLVYQLGNFERIITSDVYNINQVLQLYAASYEEFKSVIPPIMISDLTMRSPKDHSYKVFKKISAIMKSKYNIICDYGIMTESNKREIIVQLTMYDPYFFEFLDLEHRIMDVQQSVEWLYTRVVQNGIREIKPIKEL